MVDWSEFSFSFTVTLSRTVSRSDSPLCHKSALCPHFVMYQLSITVEVMLGEEL